MSSPQVIGPFHPPHSGDQIKAGGLAVLGTDIFYFETKGDNTIWVTNGDLTQKTSMSSSDAWNQYQLKVTDGNSGTFTPYTAARSAAVIVPFTTGNLPSTKLYFFWIDSNNGNKVYATSTSSVAGPWDPKVEIYSDTGGQNHLQVSGSGISVMVFGEKVVLSWLSSDEDTAHWMMLDPAQITWNSSKGKWSWVPTVNSTHVSASKVDSSLTTLGTDVTNAWFTQGGADNYLVSAFYGVTGSDVADHQTLLMLVKLDENGLPTGKLLKQKSLTAYNKSVCLQRDPCGQIRMYYADSDNVLQAVTLYTDSLDMNLSSAAPLNGNSSVQIQDSPSATFALDVLVQDPNDENHSTRDVYEVVMYGDDTQQDASNANEVDLTCQIAYYGQLENIVAIETLDYYNYTTQPWAAGLIMDGPFPVPSYAVQDLAPYTQIASVRYNVTETYGSGHTVEASVAAGIKTSGEAVVGVGVAWDISITAGVTGTMSDSHRTEVEESRNGFTSTQANEGGMTVSNQGTIYVNHLTWVRNESHMLDPNGNLVTTAPINSTIIVNPTDRYQIEYPVYSTTPGDLNSYSPDGINATMNALFPPGCDYRKNWGDWGTNYYQEVIEANAQPLTSNKNYLEFVIGPSGMTSQAFNDITQTFTEFGWTLDSSIWAGVAAAFEAEETKFFGFDASVTAQGLVGVDFSVKTADATEQEEDWGIYVEVDSEFVHNLTHSYTVRLYLLKSSPRWVDELIQANEGKTVENLNQLDTYAAPLKIVFVVTQM